MDNYLTCSKFKICSLDFVVLNFVPENKRSSGNVTLHVVKCFSEFRCNLIFWDGSPFLFVNYNNYNYQFQIMAPFYQRTSLEATQGRLSTYRLSDTQER